MLTSFDKIYEFAKTEWEKGRIRISGAGSGSTTLTNGSGSGRPKNMRIRIPNTALLFVLLLLAQVMLNDLSRGLFPAQTWSCWLSSVLTFNFLLKFCVKILFCKHYFILLSTFMRKGKDPDPDPYLWLNGSGSGRPKIMWIRIPTLHCCCWPRWCRMTCRADFVLKFYFASIISVWSTPLWEKGRKLIQSRFWSRIRIHTSDPDPDPYLRSGRPKNMRIRIQLRIPNTALLYCCCWLRWCQMTCRAVCSLLGTWSCCLSSVLKFNFLLKFCVNLKFYFASIISVRSASLWVKGRVWSRI